MASFEDYDEFGNYIGADIDSDDEPGFLARGTSGRACTMQQQPLEGYDEGPTDAGPGLALNGGRRCVLFLPKARANS